MNNKNKTIGAWALDKNDFPVFEYTGKIPYKATCKDGSSVKLPEDPWFLMGNYQFTLFSHISGEYELITGQRSWGRMNFGKKPNSGNNQCKITISNPSSNQNQTYNLVGINSLSGNEEICKRKFGIGYAKYEYSLDEVEISRSLHIKPSANIDGGSPAFIVTFEIKNTSKNELQINLGESLNANYSEIQFQYIPENSQQVQFEYTPFEDLKTDSVGFNIKAKTKDPLLTRSSKDISMVETFPPSLFMSKISENTEIVLDKENRTVTGKAQFELAPNHTKKICFMIGFFTENINIRSIQEDLADFSFENGFASHWQKVIPTFDSESDPIIKRELKWHAYCLESMATYSEYYKETKIPQGTIYDYDWGKHASARDNLQHALPCVYYNPKLAKSTLRYILKRTTAFGEVRLIEYGNGYAEHEGYFTSDQQLFLFLLLSEYLRVSKDYDFLSETITPYPADENAPKVSICHMIERCFTFLRDTIGTGKHGLVRLYNSDWNDTLYYIEKFPYNLVVRNGESHMNCAMVASIFPTLISELKNAKVAPELIFSMEIYHQNIFDAFIKDTGTRVFPRRMYFADKAYGEENMFLEPMGYTLQIADFSQKKKIALYSEMQKRLYNGEKLGARQQENPEFESLEYDKGSRENGGFWWALNGPVILGVNTFDNQEAKRLLQMMSLDNMSKNFPEYWCCYWDAADNIESSLIPQEGLSDQSFNYSLVPHCCAHPHAWFLYCWYKLQN